MTTTTATKMTPQAAYDLYVKACEAAEAAAAACVPTPMVVGTTVGLSNQIDPTKPLYYVPSGVCGFAWVKIRPATGAFVNMLKKRGVGYKSYSGGYEVPSYLFAASTRSSQSMEIAEAAARAAAAVLNEAGLTAYVQSRMD